MFVLGQFSVHFALTAYSPAILAENTGLFDSLWIVRGIVKLFVDMYMIQAFLSTFSYLVRLKTE